MRAFFMSEAQGTMVFVESFGVFQMIGVTGVGPVN